MKRARSEEDPPAIDEPAAAGYDMLLPELELEVIVGNLSIQEFLAGELINRRWRAMHDQAIAAIYRRDFGNRLVDGHPTLAFATRLWQAYRQDLKPATLYTLAGLGLRVLAAFMWQRVNSDGERLFQIENVDEYRARIAEAAPGPSVPAQEPYDNGRLIRQHRCRADALCHRTGRFATADEAGDFDMMSIRALSRDQGHKTDEVGAVLLSRFALKREDMRGRPKPPRRRWPTTTAPLPNLVSNLGGVTWRLRAEPRTGEHAFFVAEHWDAFFYPALPDVTYVDDTSGTPVLRVQVQLSLDEETGVLAVAMRVVAVNVDAVLAYVERIRKPPHDWFTDAVLFEGHTQHRYMVIRPDVAVETLPSELRRMYRVLFLQRAAQWPAGADVVRSLDALLAARFTHYRIDKAVAFSTQGAVRV